MYITDVQKSRKVEWTQPKAQSILDPNKQGSNALTHTQSQPYIIALELP